MPKDAVGTPVRQGVPTRSASPWLEGEASEAMAERDPVPTGRCVLGHEHVMVTSSL